MDSFNKQKNEQEKLKQTELKTKIDNTKSRFILEYIFNHLVKRRSLKIINYNKKLQKKLGINFEDYKTFYNEVIIEIIPAENKCGNFINIVNKDEKLYYHIFFNNEKKRNKKKLYR